MPIARRALGRVLVGILASFVVSYAAEWLAMQFTLPGTIVAIVWPASGLAVAIGILVSPWTAVGTVLADALYQYPVMGSARLAAISGLALGLQVFVISGIVRRYLGGPAALTTPAGVVKYAVFGGGLGTLISASLGIAALYAEGWIPADELAISWLTWWGSDVVSILLVTPLVLVWTQRSERFAVPRRELVALAVVVLAVTAAFLAFPFGSTSFVLAILALPLVSWAAFRFGAPAVVTVTSAIAIAAFVQLSVPWRSSAPDLFALLEAQCFIALVSATGLALAAYVRQEAVRMQQAAVAEFAAVDAARNRLLSTFAHELNNPLTPILLELELMREDHGDPLAPRQKKALGVVERNVMRLSKLVRDLRDVGHLQAGGGIRLRPVATDVSALAEEVAESYRAIASAAGLDLEVRSRGPARVHADPDRLAQVLSNLVDNAIKYTPAGGRVEIVTAVRGHGASITVRDGGPGVTSDQLARLFQPFEQVQPQAAQKNGTGLGLYIARGIVEGHGGRITCVSEGTGRGATFVVELPHEALGAPTAVAMPATRGTAA